MGVDTGARYGYNRLYFLPALPTAVNVFAFQIGLQGNDRVINKQGFPCPGEDATFCPVQSTIQW
jgi:hypothetical protein